MTTNELRVTDNDNGEITVTLNGKEVRGWSYENSAQQMTKMICAREYVEGWYDGYAHGIDRGIKALDNVMVKP